MPTTTWPGGVRPYGMIEFRAMASPCRIVTDTDDLARTGVALVRRFERLWSRFRPDSEVSLVNAAAGAPCRVAPETALLFSRAELARRELGGCFNPFVLDRLEALGDGPDADEVDDIEPREVRSEPIEVIPGASIVRLPDGVRFDPGGIGKGLAADLVLEHLVRHGATTVQIELGGDVRVHGPSWTTTRTTTRWSVHVLDPRDRETLLAQLTLDAGAAATSSVLGRTWVRAGRPHHHIIDPTTGLPSRTDLLSVTATSSELWWAEVVAKSALIAGSRSAADLLRRHRCAGLLLDRRGDVRSVGCAPAEAVA